MSFNKNVNQKIRILNYLWIEAEKTSSDYYFHVQHEVAILIWQTKKKPQNTKTRWKAYIFVFFFFTHETELLIPSLKWRKEKTLCLIGCHINPSWKRIFTAERMNKAYESHGILNRLNTVDQSINNALVEKYENLMGRG